MITFRFCVICTICNAHVCMLQVPPLLFIFQVYLQNSCKPLCIKSLSKPWPWQTVPLPASRGNRPHHQQQTLDLAPLQAPYPPTHLRPEWFSPDPLLLTGWPTLLLPQGGPLLTLEQLCHRWWANNRDRWMKFPWYFRNIEVLIRWENVQIKIHLEDLLLFGALGLLDEGLMNTFLWKPEICFFFVCSSKLTGAHSDSFCQHSTGHTFPLKDFAIVFCHSKLL